MRRGFGGFHIPHTRQPLQARPLVFVPLLALGIATLPVKLYAQDTAGTILEAVQDSSRAAVPNAMTG